LNYFHYSAGGTMIQSSSFIGSHGDSTIATMMTKRNCWYGALALPLVLGPVWCLALSFQSHWLGTLSGLMLLAVLAACAVTDVRGHRIYNWATYSAFLWAVLINIVASIWPTGDHLYSSASLTEVTVGPKLLGDVGIVQSLGGAALCFFITLAGYHMSGRGAGDVKLATVIGALLGINHGVFAVAYSYIVAAVAIVLWSTWVIGPLAIAKAFLRTIGTWLGPLWPFTPTASDSALMLRPIPLGPYFAIGTLLVVLELVPVWQSGIQ
jgi:Flp pilus assembly protein protease CpaA